MYVSIPSRRCCYLGKYSGSWLMTNGYERLIGPSVKSGPIEFYNRKLLKFSNSISIKYAVIIMKISMMAVISLTIREDERRVMG